MSNLLLEFTTLTPKYIENAGYNLITFIFNNIDDMLFYARREYTGSPGFLDTITIRVMKAYFNDKTKTIYGSKLNYSDSNHIVHHVINVYADTIIFRFLKMKKEDLFNDSVVVFYQCLMTIAHEFMHAILPYCKTKKQWKIDEERVEFLAKYAVNSYLSQAPDLYNIKSPVRPTDKTDSVKGSVQTDSKQ